MTNEVRHLCQDAVLNFEDVSDAQSAREGKYIDARCAVTRQGSVCRAQGCGPGPVRKQILNFAE